jgi:hypothetical protein
MNGDISETHKEKKEVSYRQREETLKKRKKKKKERDLDKSLFG